MANYDISEAFEVIEDELISSMMRNLSRHRIEEVSQGMEWEQWQVLQLQALEEYRKRNQKNFPPRFNKLNGQIANALHTSYQSGATSQERQILQAIQNGYQPPVSAFSGQTEITGEFFKTNDRKLNSLVNATVSDMSKAEYSVLRQTDDQYRQIIFNAQVYANTGAGTYEKAVDMATKDFLKAGINSIQYKNGSRHTIEEYSRMAIQTAMKRAYLQGEGDKRKEFGIPTVILKKRTCACPKCLPFVGKVFIDDVWSGGEAYINGENKNKSLNARAYDGVLTGKSPITGIEYPLLSQAIALGLYHPNCRDTHSTYYEGISTPPEDSTYTAEELDEIAEKYKAEQQQSYCENQADRYHRLSKYSLDSDNKRMYGARATVWDNKAEVYKNKLDYMSNSFRPKFESAKDIYFTKRLNQEDIQVPISVKKVSNSKFDIVTDIDNSRRNKALRLVERIMPEIQEFLPSNFELPQIAIVDFDKNKFGVDAIGGYDKETGLLYLNSKYNTVEKIVEYVNEITGMFANTTKYAPILHELGHKYYYDCIKSLAKYKNMLYDKVKYIVDDILTDFIKKSNIQNNPLFLSNQLSYYAQSGYNNHNVSEIVAECFSVKDNNQFAKRFIQMLGEIMMMLKPTAEEKELIQKSKETTSQEELQKIQERLTKIYHQQIEELKKKGCPFVDD